MKSNEQLEQENKAYEQDLKLIVNAIYQILDALGILEKINSGEELNIGRIFPQILSKAMNGEFTAKLANLKTLYPLVTKYKHLVDYGKENK